MPVTRTEDQPKRLGSLGYPGFAYLADPRNVANPATVVLAALQGRGVQARVTEALPWVLVAFGDLDWDWLVDQAKLLNVQNRLGYLVMLAREVAERRGESMVANKLANGAEAQESRLAKEDSLGRELTEVERRHLREHRPAAAAHWNLLTSLRAEDLRHGAWVLSGRTYLQRSLTPGRQLRCQVRRPCV